MNVYQKINEVKKEVKVFVKDSETSGKGAYKYCSGSQILGKIKDKMEEVGLLFLPIKTEPRGWTTFNYKNFKGEEKTDFIVDGKLFYKWQNIDEPTDEMIVEFDFFGQQGDISKAFGSGLTYSERYLLLKSLGVPTDEDDPDKVTEPKTQIQEDAKPRNKANNDDKRSQWVKINDLIKDTDITLASVTEWIVKVFKQDIKINDLTPEQFERVYTALKKQLGK